MVYQPSSPDHQRFQPLQRRCRGGGLVPGMGLVQGLASRLVGGVPQMQKSLVLCWDKSSRPRTVLISRKFHPSKDDHCSSFATFWIRFEHFFRLIKFEIRDILHQVFILLRLMKNPKPTVFEVFTFFPSKLGRLDIRSRNQGSWGTGLHISKGYLGTDWAE